MNAADMGAYLAERAADVAEYLLPNGKKSNGEWCVGSISGEAGKSLKVRVTGAKRGTWKDFNEGSGGDLLDLWAACKMLSIAQAMREISAHFGIRDDAPLEKPHHNYKLPEKPKARAAREGAYDWLVSRGLSIQTIEAYRIAEQIHGDKTYAIFPYLRDGVYVNGKYRNVAEKKDMRQEAGAEPCLFGWDLVNPKCRTICITEGEIDAMTLHQLGYAALSVNAGAGNHQWIDSDWERLERFSEILLCYDADEAGQKGAREVAKRLGLDRCKVVTFGEYKDANEAFQKCSEPSSQFAHWMASGRTFDPDELRQLSDFWSEVKASFWPAAGKESLYPPLKLQGDTLSWFEFRPGELTVWTGYNGHGKSLILNQILIAVLQFGERMCVFSGEMLPVQQGRRMAKQLTGVDRPTPAYLDAAGQWVQDRCWIFNLAETATLDRLIEVFRYGFKRYGIHHFVIDSLMMTDVPEDGPGAMSAQKEAMRKLAAFARSNLVHVHLVAHPRKGQDEKHGPGKLDVSGSGKLTDAADNVFSVWADKKEEGERPDTPDGYLKIHKQRNGDIQEKTTWLFFNRACQQYGIRGDRRPFQYLKFSTQEQFA